MEWYLAVLKKYADFSGRARRREYWMFALINFIISSILGFIGGILHLPYVLTLLYTLATLIPALAVAMRRLHDTNRSGWTLLLLLIPFIGAIIVLVFVIQDGTPGDNRFGPNPKSAAAVAAIPA